MSSYLTAMTASIPHQGVQASPDSSEEVGSYRDTPATKISPFSSQGNRGQLKSAGTGFSRSKLPPQFLLFSPSEITGGSASPRPQDPFVSGPNLSGTTQASYDASKLSPNASTFTPTTLVASGSAKAVARDVKNLLTPAVQDRIPVLRQYGLVGGPSANGPFFKMGMFSSESGTSRCIGIDQVLGVPSLKEINDLFHLNIFPSRTHLFVGDKDNVYVKFADIRDSEKAISWLNTLSYKCTAQYVPPTKLAPRLEQEKDAHTNASVYEGQVVVTATFARAPRHIDVDATGKFISELVSDYGNVMAFEVSPGQTLGVTYHMEFCDLRAADKALADLNELKFDTFTLNIAPYSPNLDADTQNSPKLPGHSTSIQDLAFDKAFGSMSLKHQREYSSQSLHTPCSPFLYQSPSNSPLAFRKHPGGLLTPSSLSSFSRGTFDQPSTWGPTYSPFSDFSQHSPVWPPFSPGTIGQERGTPQGLYTDQERYNQQKRGVGQVIRRYYENPTGHHNIVNIDRIRQGTDVRTTIMLRNIPNKIDQAMLKEIIDETSFGKYDFMYLRIDFANNCNVGYAFINFEDPYHIIGFVTTRAGQRWNRYNSDKVAEVSYATIQGRDCLVQKFRNSSVMLEHVSFRPKIFHTTGPRAGQEDTFPGPDNPSKMRRSVENAAHVGLFAPRAGQSFRDEQRRRRSQYDRGTRLAEIEDAFDDGSRTYRYSSNAFSIGTAYGGFNAPLYFGLPSLGTPI